MGELLSCFWQILLLSCAPFALFGIAVYFCRGCFIYLMGRHGERFTVCFLALSTPLREVGHVCMATIFAHRVGDVCFLNLHDPDGELGYVEHSYTPRNPIAILGNFFYALAPMIVGLFAVYAVLAVCFGDTMPELSASLSALSGAGFLDYARLTLGLLPAMLRADVSVLRKLLGFALLLLLCMGIYVSLGELLDAIGGFCIFAGLAFVLCGVLMLFDVRIRNILLSALRGFAAQITALFLCVLLGVGILLLVSAIYFLIHGLFFTGGEDSTALTLYLDN